MAYSFSVTAPSVPGLRTKLTAAFDKLTKRQADHKAVCAVAEDCAMALLDELEPDGSERAVYVLVSGSVSGDRVDRSLERTTGATAQVTVALVP